MSEPSVSGAGRTARVAGVEGESVEIAAQPDRIRTAVEGWRRLAAAGPGVYSTPEWTQAWLAPTERPAVAVTRDRAGDVVGVLALVRRPTIAGGRLAFPGSGLGDAFGLCVADGASTCAEGIGAALGHAVARHGLWLDHVDASEDWPERLGRAAGVGTARPWPAAEHPMVDLSEGYDAYEAGLSRNLRKGARRRRARLERIGEVHHRTTVDRRALAGDLDAFFGLHLRRTAALRLRSPLRRPATRWRYARFAAMALERGWLRLRVLEVDGRPIAATMNWDAGRRLQCALSGFDPAFAEYGPGILAELENLRAAAAEGATVVDLGLGDSEYKRRLATHARRTTTVLVAPRPHPVRVVVAARRAVARRLPADVRTRARSALDGLRRS